MFTALAEAFIMLRDKRQRELVRRVALAVWIIAKDGGLFAEFYSGIRGQGDSVPGHFFGDAGSQFMDLLLAEPTGYISYEIVPETAPIVLMILDGIDQMTGIKPQSRFNAFVGMLIEAHNLDNTPPPAELLAEYVLDKVKSKS